MYQPFVFDNNVCLETAHVRAATERLDAEERALFGWDVGSLDWRDYWMNVQIPGLDKWSLPLLHGERIPEDPAFDLGVDLHEYVYDVARDEPANGRVRPLRSISNDAE